MRLFPPLAIIALASPAVAAAQYPVAPPAAAPLTAPVPLKVQDFVLPNQLRVSLIENHRQPVISIALSLPAGTAYDPSNESGLADMLTALLTRGAGSRDADAVAEAMEQIGGSLGASVDPDFLSVTADALSAHAESALQLLADAALRPRLDPQEIDQLRQQTIASVQSELTRPGSAASRIFLAALYGPHPYGLRPTRESLNNIGRRELEAFRLARFRPVGAQLIIAGDITLGEARRLATGAFGEWKGLAPAPLAARALPRFGTQIVLVHVPGAESASLLIGNSTFRGADSNYYGAVVADRLFGSAPDSRISRVLREERHWASSSATALSRPTGIGMFQVGVEVSTVQADSVIAEVLAQMRRLRKDTVGTAELEAAKAQVGGAFPLGVQSVNQVVGAVLKAKRLGLPVSTVTSYRSRVAAITPVRLRSVARTLLRPDSCLVVVVGDGGRLYRGLRALAPVRLLAPDGTALNPADVETKVAALEIDPSRLVARRDSFLVVAQGRTVGVQVSSMERSAGQLSYTEATNIGTIISQTTTVNMDTLGRMVSLAQTGRLQGQDTKIDLAYGGGRVKGAARVIGRNGPTSFTVDTTVPAGILDDNAVQAVLPALKWAPNVQWAIPVFASGQNRVRPLTLTVRAIGTVTIPAGSFQAYMAELEGDDQKVTFYVSVDSPHRLLRLTISGTPLEFVAASSP